ncbi:MAG: carboxypeptidase regulatory-like domain-containing protein [Blastocatellia bacterium]
MKLIFRYALPALAVLILWPDPRGLAQTGGIKGKVKEQGGKSLDDVLVRAIHARNKENTHETRTDSRGDFELTGLPGGEYSLSFEKQGFKSFTTRKLEVIPGETIRLSRAIEISRESDPYAVIRGAVLYGIGYTLPNATITLERIDGEKRFKQETISREGGEFAFRLKPEKARYRITAAARGFQSASTEIEILSDEVRNVALTLQQEK